MISVVEKNKNEIQKLTDIFVLRDIWFELWKNGHSFGPYVSRFLCGVKSLSSLYYTRTEFQLGKNEGHPNVRIYSIHNFITRVNPI